MSTLRIKVQIGDEKTAVNRKVYPFRKFIYIIDSPSNKTINELLQKLREYIIEKFSFTKIQIVELMTDDGFILSKSDMCSSALKDNDHIICVDMEKFINEFYPRPNVSVIWLDLKQHDASDDNEKYIRIGLNGFSELFVRMHGLSYVSALYIFGVYELTKIANEKRTDNLIGRLDNTSGYEQSSIEWLLETKWEYDTVSNKDLFIICNVKMGSSDQICSNKLHILLDQSYTRIQKGEVTRLSDETTDGTTLTDQQKRRLKELVSKIPPPKRTGPQITINTNDNRKLTKHESEGESSIRMAYGNTNTVTIDQDTNTSNDEIFNQYFFISHIIFSKKPTVLPEILQQKRSAPVDKPVSVASLTVVYQIHDGSWRECQEVAIAPIAMRDEEPKWLTDSVINIEPDKLISFSIKGWIPIKGESGRDNESRRRVHKSLPQPLKLKIVITDNFGKQCSLIVEQLNKPPEIATRESFLKNNQSSIIEFLAFIYADDCELDERLCMAIYIGKDNRLVIKKCDTSYATYDRKALHTLQFNAKQSKTTEIPMKQAHYKYQSQENNAIALFDPETYLFYAVRLEISTKTSRAEETALIPMEKIQ